MLLTIHNLPSTIRYADVKSLLLSKCGFSEVILDNLVNEGKTKKVTVGLPEEADAAILTRNINGIYLEGKQLYVRDVRQKLPSDQPYYQSSAKAESMQSDYQAEMSQYQNQGYQQSQQQYMGQGMMPVMVPPGMMGGMYYMPQMQNAYMDYSGQGQMGASQYPQFSGQQNQPQGSQANKPKPYQGNQSSNFADRAKRSYDNDSHSQPNKKPRYNDDRRDGGSRHRSRSPGLGGPPGNYGYQQRDAPRDSNQGSQRYGFGRNESFSSRNNDQQSSSSINQKLINFANNQPVQSPWENQQGPNQGSFDDGSQGRNNWEQAGSSFGNNRQGNWGQGQAPSWDNQGPADNNTVQGRAWNKPSNDNQSQQNNWRNNAPGGSQAQNRWGQEKSQASDSRPKPAAVPTPSKQPSYNSRTFENKNLTQQKPWEKKFGPSTSQQQRPFNSFKPGGNQGQSNKKKKGRALDNTALIKRDLSFRSEATATIVKGMRSKEPLTEVVLKNLKKAVRARLEILLGERIGASQEEMVEKYRTRFQYFDDKRLIKTVSQMEDSEEPTPLPPAKILPAKPKINPNQLRNEIPEILAPADKLPQYPNADKQVYRAIKKRQKQEFKDDNYYQEDMMAKEPLAEAELLKEADAICGIITNILENPDDESEKSTCSKVLRQFLPDFKKAVILNVTRRILNVCTGLVVRVFVAGKPPKKAELERFLAKYDVVAMKKAQKRLMYTVTVGSYKAYDQLCDLRKVPFSELTTLLFKPFQLTGPKLSFRERKELAKKCKARSRIMLSHQVEGAEEEEEEGAEEDQEGEQGAAQEDLDEEENGGGADEEELMDSMENAEEVEDEAEGSERGDGGLNEADLEDW